MMRGAILLVIFLLTSVLAADASDKDKKPSPEQVEYILRTTRNLSGMDLRGLDLSGFDERIFNADFRRV